MYDRCSITPETLSAFVDGELPAREQRTLAQHITTCQACSHQLGTMYALKVYVGCHDQQPASVPSRLWEAVRRGLDEVDVVVKKIAPIGPRPVPAWRLGALVAAGVLLIVLAAGARRTFAPPSWNWSHLAQAHKIAAARVLPDMTGLGRFGTTDDAMTEVAWQPAHSQAIRADRCSGRQELYTTRGAAFSHFTIPCNSLDVSTLTQVHHAGQWLYLDTRGDLAMVAWRQGTGWGILVGDFYIEQLLALARLYAQPARLTPDF